MEHPRLKDWDIDHLHRLLYYMTDLEAELEDCIMHSRRTQSCDLTTAYECNLFFVHRLLNEVKETIRRKEL